MKRINLIIISLLLTACGGGGDDTPEPKENQAPAKVNSLVFPTNNLLCTTNTLDFEWGEVEDPDGDTVSYLLEISSDNLFTSVDESHTVSGKTKSVTVEKNTAYYWRVKAIDSKGLSSDFSNVFQFYTEGEAEINHLPFAPRLTSPELDASVTNTSTNLIWECSDVDNDPLTFDVYFGTTNPPTNKIGDNISEKSLSVNLNTTTTYYWYVVAKDGNGGESIGQVWDFSTN